MLVASRAWEFCCVSHQSRRARSAPFARDILSRRLPQRRRRVRLPLVPLFARNLHRSSCWTSVDRFESILETTLARDLPGSAIGGGAVSRAWP